MTFDSRLRALRQQRGLTVSDLGRKAGMSAPQISRYERGLQPTIDALARLSKALDVPVETLAAPVLRAALANSPVAPELSRG